MSIMDTANNSSLTLSYESQKSKQSEIYYSSILYQPKTSNASQTQTNYYNNNHFLGNKRVHPQSKYLLPNTITNLSKDPQSKCFICSISSQGKIATCSCCFRTFHFTCLPQEESDYIIKNKWISYTCKDCRNKMNKMSHIKQSLVVSKSFMINSKQFNDFNKETKMQHMDINNNNNKFNEYFSSHFNKTLHNSKMTNEDKMKFNMKNNNDISVNPYLMKVLNEGENWKFNYGNNFNIKKEDLIITKSNNPNDKLYQNKIQFEIKNDSNCNIISNQTQLNNINIHNLTYQFPIDDELLFNYPDTFQINKDSFNRPDGEEILIPFQLFNQLLIIWNFLHTFKDILCEDSLLQYEISNDILIFNTNLQKDKNNRLFKQIVLSFLLLTVKNFKNSNYNLYDKEIYIVKSFLENPNSSSIVIFSNCICEIMRIVTNCKKNHHLISKEIFKIIKEINRKYSFDIKFDKKIKLLNTLVAIAYETNIINEKIKEDNRTYINLLAKKSSLENALRDTEKRNKEIEKRARFEDFEAEIEKLNNKLEELNENNSPKDKKIRNEIELQIARYQSILKEKANLQLRKREIIDNIKQTKDNILNIKVINKPYLGADYKKREYYYFNLMQGYIFIKNKKDKKWNVIVKREDIDVIVSKLHDKGIRERKLKINIIQVFNDLKEQSQRDDTIVYSTINKKQSNNNIKEDIEIELGENEFNIQVKEELNKNISIEENNNYIINEILLKMESRFTVYLEQFNKQWESNNNREEWKKIIQSTKDPKNFIASLKMFNYRFKNPYKLTISEKDKFNYEDSKYSIPEETLKYTFYNEKGKILVIYETDPNKVLGPKVKIWPKEAESNQIDTYYTKIILNHLSNKEKFFFALHFFEYLIFTLIKRRDPKKIIHNNTLIL